MAGLSVGGSSVGEISDEGVSGAFVIQLTSAYSRLGRAGSSSILV